VGARPGKTQLLKIRQEGVTSRNLVTPVHHTVARK
jgi:hypothetical protein